MIRRIAGSLLSRLPLAVKAVTASLIIGLLVWQLLSQWQEQQMHRTFMHQLSAELSMHAEHDRRRFDEAIQQLHHVSRLISGQSQFIDYVRRPEWQQRSGRAIVHHATRPKWMPGASILRAYFNARYALLLDARGEVAEAYHHIYLPGSEEQLPVALLQPEPLLRQLSHNQSYMTTLDGHPYVIAAETIEHDGQPLATLIVCSPIDSEFLLSMRSLTDGLTTIALLEADSQEVVASSNTQAIPIASLARDLEGRFLMVGRSFFDYGASDLELQFTSFISTSRAEQLAHELLQKSAQQRVVLITSLVLIFTLLTVWYSRRIASLQQNVAEVTDKLLGAPVSTAGGGDEIETLKRQFDQLSEAIVQSRRQLEQEAEDRLQLNIAYLEGIQRERELESLKSVTETLGVGIIIDGADGLQPFNSLMERFATECGDLHHFTRDEAVAEYELGCSDMTGNSRYFTIHHHPALGPRGVMVRDVTALKATEEELELFSNFPAKNPNPILRVSLDGELVYANVAGLSLLANEGLGIGDRLSKRWREALQKSTEKGASEAIEISVGKHCFSFVPAHLDNSNFVYLYGLDVTERKAAEEEMRLSAAITRNVLDGIMVTGIDGTIRNVNPAFCEITGYLEEELVGRNPRILKSHRHSQEFYDQMWDSLQREGVWEGEVWNRRKDGELLPCSTRISAIHDAAGKTVSYVAVYTDISEHKRQEERLSRMAYHDALTGLPNRALFYDRLGHAITLAGRSRHPLALLFVDLDGFKEVNDLHGHEYGDLLLQKVAERLLASVRDSDTVSRLGGDEFAVILQDVEEDETARQVAEKVLAGLTRPFDLYGKIANISGSIGIATYPEQGEDTDSLLRNADKAMYAAKKAGKNTVRNFS